MPATIKCDKCGRMTTARIIEDDPSTNSLVLEEDPDWKDEDEEPTTCTHEEYTVIDITHDHD